MKPARSLIAGALILCTIFLPSAMANHRTGTLAIPEVMTSADFDGDGNLDIAVNLAGFDVAAIFLGNGQGNFKLKTHYKLDTLPKGLAAADMNQDGHPDLVSCAAWGYSVQLLLGDTLGGFSSAGYLKGDGEPTRLLLRDFNNDGKLDIAVNAPEEGKIIFYFGDGRGGFSTPPEEIGGYPNTAQIATADLDTDGNLDIVTLTSTGTQPGSAHVAVLLGNGRGGFNQSDFVPVTSSPNALAIGDLNNDGKRDFVVAGAEPHNAEGNFISTFLGDGNGHFALKQTIDLGPGNLKGIIAIGDFNEDGNLDVAYPQTGNLQGSHSRNVFIFFGTGTGKLVAGPTVIVGQEPDSVITADFNKDGHLDLAVTNRTDGTMSVCLGNGKGDFTVISTLSVVSTALNP